MSDFFFFFRFFFFVFARGRPRSSFRLPSCVFGIDSCLPCFGVCDPHPLSLTFFWPSRGREGFLVGSGAGKGGVPPASKDRKVPR